VHFLLLGAAIYGVYFAFASEPEGPENRLTVTAGEIGWLIASWEKRWNRPPTAEEPAAGRGPLAGSCWTECVLLGPIENAA